MKKLAAGLVATIAAAGCSGGGDNAAFPQHLADRLGQIETEAFLPHLTDILDHEYEQYGNTRVGQLTLYFATVGDVSTHARVPVDEFVSAAEFFQEIAAIDDETETPLLDSDGLSDTTLKVKLADRPESENYILTVDGSIEIDGFGPIGDNTGGFVDSAHEPTITLFPTFPDGSIDLIRGVALACHSVLHVQSSNSGELNTDQITADAMAGSSICDTLGDALVAARYAELSYEEYRQMNEDGATEAEFPAIPSGELVAGPGIVDPELYDALKRGQAISLDGHIFYPEALTEPETITA